MPIAPWKWCLVLLGVGLVAGCAGEAQPRSQDATVVDRGSAMDLTIVDREADNDVLTGPDVSFDASADLGLDATVDAAVDVALDAVDVPDPWGDAPRVDLGGILVPVDPHAVPAPGSECTGDGGLRMGDPTIAPPRPIRPLSVSRVTSQRPTFLWVLPEGATGARVEVCADRCCTRVLQTIDAEGTTVRPTTALPPGVVFWRMFGRRGTVVGSRASYTWEFGVRHRDAPNDTSWGTIRDFNGDGFDDLFMFRLPMERDDRADLLIMTGSSEGLRAPAPTGIVAERLPWELARGDFDGDGRLDIAWSECDAVREHSWITVVTSEIGTPVARSLPEFRPLGACAGTGLGTSVDWNGDGYSDLLTSIVFGCRSAEPVEASILFVYAGSPGGLAPVPQAAWRLDGLFAHPLVLTRAALEDLDLDGYGDVVATSLFSGAGTTHVHDQIAVLLGSPTGTPRIELLPEPIPTPRDWGRGTPESVGDVDGDGHTDLLIGGDQYRFYRHPTGLRSPSSTLVFPLRFSVEWASSGDLDGDGLSDVIAASIEAHEELRDAFPYNRGRVYVFPGSSAGLSSDPAIIATTRLPTDSATYDFFGTAAMSPGDVNGDGIDDLVALDSFEERLCTLFGSLDLSSGPPSSCMNGITTNRLSIHTLVY